MTSYAGVHDVVAHFEGKTAAILKRYGPGPRVHYHAGLLDEPPHLDGSAEVLRRELVIAQERTLSCAAKVWEASSRLCGDVLDVGCGLGGGAIFWAQEYGARVTAVTCVPSHVNRVARFAEQAGVGSRIQPLLCDALEVPGSHRFDAVVAVDSSCYLPRKPWFLRLASLLRPGGHVFISDCFLVGMGCAERFDRYWHTRIGTIDEYLSSAGQAGLEPILIEDCSYRTVNFWTTTLALIHIEARGAGLGPEDVARYEASLGAHALVRQGLGNGGLRYCLMGFAKGG